jgi:hypothetical protein
MVAKTRVLLAGLDPDIIDHSKSSVPGLTAAKVSATVVECDKGIPAALVRAAAAALADVPATAFAPVLPLVRCRNSEDEQLARLSGLTGATPVQI